jgi:hypothetical protein
VDEKNVRIEKGPIATICSGDETEEELAAREAERLAWEQMKLPMWFEALLCWGFRRVCKRFYRVD